MSEQTTLTQEELDFLKKAKEEGQQIIASFGQIQIERINLNMRIAELDKVQAETEARFKDVLEREQKFTQSLFEKYGDAMIDIETGTISKNS
jgi:hypothetical protein